MPVRQLVANPNLDHLKHQAKDLLRDHAARRPDCAQRIREFHPKFGQASDAKIFAATLQLSDAQLAIAREAGFSNWARLKRHIESPTLADRLDLKHHERIEDPLFRLGVEMIDAGDVAGLRELLRRYPKLVHQQVLLEGGNYFRAPTLLNFIAENPIRHGKVPTNIVEVTRVILEAGPDLASRNETLMLVATGSVVRECGVQVPLLELLCKYGADPSTAAHRAAAVLDEHDAARALLRLGAKVDLVVAAALGLPEFSDLLADATADDRQLALSVAANYGRVEIVGALLDAGVDPDRYNPPGGHAHATPLHQAAGYGHLEVVRLLVERGARTDLKDVLWGATPMEWAEHQGKVEVVRFLREREMEHELVAVR